MVQIPSDMGIYSSLNINKQEKDKFKINISYVDQNLHDSKKLINTDSTPFVYEALDANTSQIRTNVLYLDWYFYQIRPTSLYRLQTRNPAYMYSFDSGSCLLFILRFFKNLTQFVKHIVLLYNFIIKYISTVYRK